MIVLIQQNAALHSGLWSSKATCEAYKKDKMHWSHLVKFHKHAIIQSYQDYTAQTENEEAFILDDKKYKINQLNVLIIICRLWLLKRHSALIQNCGHSWVYNS